MGIDGLLYSGPVGDCLAAVTVAILISGEMRIINRSIKEQNA
ncbi:unknown [Firmicutes bacterium CAG:240]|nr:unknown [Firmicutes bacterium CAG:240]